MKKTIIIDIIGGEMMIIMIVIMIVIMTMMTMMTMIIIAVATTLEEDGEDF
jgi:hypothetical protein